MSQEQNPGEHETIRRQRWELVAQSDRLTDTPMVALSFVWLGLLILDLTVGSSLLLQTMTSLIWGASWAGCSRSTPSPSLAISRPLSPATFWMVPAS